MRVVLFLLFVQFISPAFAAQDDEAGLHETTTLKVEHRSLLLPVFLKEKEENEHEEGIESNFIAQPIFNFSDHSLALIESHQSVPGRYAQWCNHQPLLFTLFCAYVI